MNLAILCINYRNGLAPVTLTGKDPLTEVIVDLSSGNTHITIIGMAFLDFFDFATNSILMPIVAFFTCILVGHIIGTKYVIDEVEKNGVFKRKALYEVMVRWVAPAILVIILAGELAKYFGIISI